MLPFSEKENYPFHSQNRYGIQAISLFSSPENSLKVKNKNKKNKNKTNISFLYK